LLAKPVTEDAALVSDEELPQVQALPAGVHKCRFEEKHRI
jgi:hypothetical protein